MAASKLLTFADLHRLKGIAYSRDQLRRLVHAGKFPAPRRIPGSQRLFYVESEEDAWMERLSKRLMRDQRLAPEAVERLIFPLLDGLEAVHAIGFLHRDIKPANIMVDDLSLIHI